MKIFVTLILIILLQTTAFSQVDCFRPTSPIELGVLVFKSFQDQNFEKFRNCFFTEADCDTLVKYAGLSDSLKIRYTKYYKNRATYFQGVAKENFEKLIEEGERKGIVWNKIELLDVSYDGPKTENNIQSADIGIECIYGDIYFGFLIEDCHKSDSWLIIDKVEIRFAN